MLSGEGGDPLIMERPVGTALPDPVGQVRMRMVGADYGTDLRGPTVCEVVDEGHGMGLAAGGVKVEPRPPARRRGKEVAAADHRTHRH